MSAALVDFVTAPQWVAWRNEMRGGKLTKVPYIAPGRPAEADDPSTWLPHDQAVLICEAIVNGTGGGIGIELGQCGRFWLIGIDLDTCRNPISGLIEAWAIEVIERLNSYAEVSPSQSGVKVFCLVDPANIPELRHVMGTSHGRQFKRTNGVAHPPAIELYTSNRYFAVTWDGLENVPNELRVVPLADLRWLIEQAGPALSGKAERKPHSTTEGTGDDTPIILGRLNTAAKHNKPIETALRNAATMHGGSRSEGAFGLGLALKRAGWTFADMKAALRACPATREWATEADERQFERIWDRPTEEKPGPKGPAREAPSRGQAFGRLVMLGMNDIDTAEPRGYLLKGLLSPNELSLWVGPPKCGKSFLLLHVAYLLSLGRSVFGRRVKPTVVLYVAAEGEAGIANRLRALRDQHGRSDNFHFIAQPADLLHDDGDKAALIDAALACGPQMIVLDTLNRLMAGGDENSSQDMGGFIRNIAHIRHQTKAHIAIVHHGTKASNGSTPRGHSSLTGADDALIEVIKLEDGTRLASVVHAKDDADGMRWGFTLEPVSLGTDEDGDPITTLIVQEMLEAPVKPQGVMAPTDNEKIGLRTLDQAMKANGIMAPVFDDHTEGLVVREADWRRWFYREGKPGAEQEAKKKAFKRASEGLLAKGLIGSRDDLVWPK